MTLAMLKKIGVGVCVVGFPSVVYGLMMYRIGYKKGCDNCAEELGRLTSWTKIITGDNDKEK